MYLLSLSGTKQEVTAYCSEFSLYYNDPTLAMPRKRMRIVIKRRDKHVRECAPCTQMVAVTSTRPKMVASNFAESSINLKW